MKKCVRKKQMIYAMVATVVCIICLVMGVTRISSYAKGEKGVNVSRTIESFVGNLKLGNAVKDVLDGGTHLELGNEAYIEAKDGKIIDKYKKKIIGFIPVTKKLVLIEGVNAKNLNILDEEGNKLDDTVYYTDNGVVKWVNVKDLSNGTIDELADKQVSMMYLADNKYLYCLCSEGVIKFDLNKKEINVFEKVENVNRFIPTETEMIYFVEGANGKDFVVNNVSLRKCIESFHKGREIQMCKFYDITKENFYIQIELKETDEELQKNMTYGVKIEDLTKEITEDSFIISYNSEYADVYDYSGNIEFKRSSEAYIGNYKIGAKIKTINEGGLALPFNAAAGIRYENNKIEYYNNNDKVILAKEKKVGNINLAEEAKKLYYTASGKLKVLDLTNGKKSKIDELSEIVMDKVHLVNEEVVYYVSAEKIYKYDINTKAIEEVEKIKENYVPCHKGIIHLVKGDMCNEIYVNDANVYDVLRENVEGELQVTSSSLNKEHLFVYGIRDNREVGYKITIEDMFDNLSYEAFSEIDIDEEYNYTSSYDVIDINNSMYFASGYQSIGNSVTEIRNGGYSLDLGEGGTIMADETGIKHLSVDGNEVLLSKAHNASNLNLMDTDNATKLYYTREDRIIELDINSGNKQTIATASGIIEKMYLVNASVLFYTVENTLYEMTLHELKEVERVVDDELIGYVPSCFDYNGVYDVNVRIHEKGIVSCGDLTNLIAAMHSEYSNYYIDYWSTDSQYLYLRTMCDDTEEINFRIMFDYLFDENIKNATDPNEWFEIYDEENGWYEEVQYNYDDSLSFALEEEYNIDGLKLGNNPTELLKGKAYSVKLENDARVKVQDGKIVYVYEEKTYHEDIGSSYREKELYDLTDILEGEVSNLSIMNGNLYFLMSGKMYALNLSNGNLKEYKGTDENGVTRFYALDFMDDIIYQSGDNIYKYDTTFETSKLIETRVGLRSFIPTDNRGNICFVDKAEYDASLVPQDDTDSEENGDEFVEDGSEENGDEFVEDGSEENGDEFVEDGSEENGDEFVEDGSEEYGDEFVEDGSEEYGDEFSEDGSEEYGDEFVEDGSEEYGDEYSEDFSEYEDFSIGELDCQNVYMLVKGSNITTQLENAIASWNTGDVFITDYRIDNDYLDISVNIGENIKHYTVSFTHVFFGPSYIHLDEDEYVPEDFDEYGNYYEDGGEYIDDSGEDYLEEDGEDYSEDSGEDYSEEDM